MSNARTIADLAAVTATATELNALDGITSNVTELNLLDGVTATTAEINYVDGVTSNVQTQIDSKVGSTHTGDVDITGELLVDSYNETFKRVSSVSAVTFALSVGSYDSKSFSVTSQESTPRGIAFKSNGTKMYVVGTVSDTVYQYSLSTAWDVSTASYDSVSLSVSSEDATPSDLIFSADGTKMYICGDANNSIFQYTLSTAWDLSTASYASISFSTTSQVVQPEGIAFKSDGTVMFIADATTNTVYQYTLSTAWDVSSASYASKSFSVASQETNTVTGMDVTSDGTKMCIVGFGVDTIFEYDLSTAWDVSTASYNSVSLSIAAQEGAPYGLRIGNDEKVYIAGNLTDTVYQYTSSTTTYSTTFDCENANVFETVLDGNTTVVFSNPPASGTPIVVGYQFANIAYDSVSLSYSALSNNAVDTLFNNDGTKLYVLIGQTRVAHQYSLSTAYDLSTASSDSVSFDFSSQDTGMGGITFNNNGTKLYAVGYTNDAVYQYSLSTAYDLSSISYDSVNVSVASQDNLPSKIKFNNDGTSFYVIGISNTTIFQYNLTSAYDLSTASYASKSFSVAAQASSGRCFVFNGDGTKLYASGDANDTIYQYSLSTTFDISTASYDSVSFSVASQASFPSALTFNSNGTKLYVTDNTSTTLYQYSTSTSTLNDSTAYAMSLKVVQDSGASGYTVTWPTSVDWPSATAPTLTATASAVDQFVFYTYDGGTTWYGFTAGQALG